MVEHQDQSRGLSKKKHGKNIVAIQTTMKGSLQTSRSEDIIVKPTFG